MVGIQHPSRPAKRQQNANMLATENSDKKRISSIKFTKAVYIVDVDVEVRIYNQEPVF
jgi:hypothetical protein